MFRAFAVSGPHARYPFDPSCWLSFISPGYSARRFSDSINDDQIGALKRPPQNSHTKWIQKGGGCMLIQNSFVFYWRNIWFWVPPSSVNPTCQRGTDLAFREKSRKRIARRPKDCWRQRGLEWTTALTVLMHSDMGERAEFPTRKYWDLMEESYRYIFWK